MKKNRHEEEIKIFMPDPPEKKRDISKVSITIFFILVVVAAFGGLIYFLRSLN